MRVTLIAVALFAVTSLQAQVPTTTTLAQQTANNTSTSDAFPGQSNGNPAAGSVSKLPIRSLLYPGSTTKIYAHVEPWWGSGSHVDIGYSSQDPAQVHRQVQDMVSRGIDGAIVDWYGPDSYEDTGVKLLLSEAEATPNFGVIVEIDVGAIHWHSCYPTCSATTAVVNLFTQANSEFFSFPAIVRWNTRPVLMEFGFETLALPTGEPTGWNVVDWNTVQSQVPGNPALLHRNLGGYAKAQSTGAFTWMDPETVANFTAGFDDTSDLTWFYSNTLSTYPTMDTYGALWKGFNDTIASWSPTGGRHIDQSCAQTWLNTFNTVNQYYSATNQLAALQLVTWNDYEEGTEVETGIDDCIAMTPTLSGTQLSWSVTGNENAVDHYTVYASPDGLNLASLGDFSTSTHSVDLSQFTLPAGSYTMFVQAIGKPSVRNEMSAGISYSVAPPLPAPAPAPTSPTPTSPTPTTPTSPTPTSPTSPTPPPTTPTTPTAATTTTVAKDVSLSAAPAALTVNPGQSGTFTLTVAQVGASDPVQLSCSAPTGVSCSFSASTLTPSSSGSQVQLTVATPAQSAQNQSDAPVFAGLFSGLGLLGLATTSSARRKRKVAVVVILGLLLLSQIACGGVGNTTTTTTPQQPTTTVTATTYTITVTAVSGTVTKSTVVTLTVG